jgi:hypothetical protein
MPRNRGKELSGARPELRATIRVVPAGWRCVGRTQELWSTVIRPFGLNDIWLVRRLQGNGVPLAIEHVLTHPNPPLWTALTAPWPWAGVGVGVATFVLNERYCGERLSGFVQLMKRAARPEADLLYLSPSLVSSEFGPDVTGAADRNSAAGRSGADGRNGADGQPACDASGEVIWGRLLTYCTKAAAAHGLQRIFASVPEGCLEADSLKAAGFSLYAREIIFRLAVVPPASGSLVGFRPQTPQDSWALQRLYTRNTPRLVQQAEGALSGEVGSPALSWWEPGSWEGVIWEPAGEVRGAVQVHIGRTGHWLRIWGANELSARELRSLIEQGLRQIARTRGVRRAMPVYVTVRDYEIGVRGGLTGFGFAPYMERTRFVKHTVAAVRQAVPAARAAIEVRQEVPVRSELHRASYVALELVPCRTPGNDEGASRNEVALRTYATTQDHG